MTVRKLDAQEPRVETGPVCFGDDWTGLFIRGDNAFGYGMAVSAAIEHLKEKGCGSDFFLLSQLESLLDNLMSCDERALRAEAVE